MGSGRTKLPNRGPRAARVLARARRRQLELAQCGRMRESAHYAQLAHRVERLLAAAAPVAAKAC